MKTTKAPRSKLNTIKPIQFEELKTEIKARFSNAIDILNESTKKYGETMETPVNKKFEGYPTIQLLIMLETFTEENKKNGVIAEKWDLKKAAEEEKTRRWE